MEKKSLGNILVVEDDVSIAHLIETYLHHASFDVSVAQTGANGLSLFHSQTPDCVILDRMLPEMDGLAVCRSIRKTSDVPILFVTARIEEAERLEGLRAGADDYIIKPFSFPELVARVEAVLRRSNRTSKSEEVPAHPLSIDPIGHVATWKSIPLPLTSSEFKLLQKFAAHPNRVFSRDDLLTELYPFASLDVIDRAIDVHIGNIRKKLRQVEEGADECLQTVRGIGYRLS